MSVLTEIYTENITLKNKDMTEIFMTIGQRCYTANLLPVIGSLQTVTESKALKKALVEGFSKAQLEAYEISKDESGLYHTSDVKKETSTKVTLSDDEVIYFQKMIQTLSQKKMCHIEMADLYNKIMAIELTDSK